MHQSKRLDLQYEDYISSYYYRRSLFINQIRLINHRRIPTGTGIQYQHLHFHSIDWTRFFVMASRKMK